jgi:hypothetical protein
MGRVKAARRDQREGPSDQTVRVRLRSPRDVLWQLGGILNRGWLLAPPGFHAEIGAPVRVVFCLPEPAAEVSTPGEVIALAPGPAPDNRLAMVRFENLAPSAKARLDALLGSWRRPGRRARHRAAWAESVQAAPALTNAAR